MKKRSVTIWVMVVVLCASSQSSADFTNGGFETGDVTGWQHTGSVEVLQTLGPIQATEGDYFACISNGPGGAENYSTLAVPGNTIEIPDWAQNIVFDWNFLTAEDTPSELFNDYGQVFITVSGGWIGGVQADTYSTGFTQIEPAGVTTPNGSFFTKHLGWQRDYVDVSGYQGRLVYLSAFNINCQDIGAADIDSAMLVDNIHFEGPEPSAPPTADADGPYSIYVGDTLTLDASGSTDPDNDIVSYIWDLDDDENFETDAGDQAILVLDYSYLQSLGLLINYTYTIHLKVTDSKDQSDVNDSTLIIVPKPALWVAVDIKPGSCPNPLNVKSSGVLPVAILGTDDYDITTITPTSIRLAGVEPLRSAYEDVAAPVGDSNDCNCTEAGPDGLLDLTLKFKTQRIVEAIGDVNDGDVRVLTLTGVLIDPIPFEWPIEGADCVLIRGRHKPINPADINKDGVVDIVDFAIFAQNWLQSSIVED